MELVHVRLAGGECRKAFLLPDTAGELGHLAPFSVDELSRPLEPVLPHELKNVPHDASGHVAGFWHHLHECPAEVAAAKEEQR